MNFENMRIIFVNNKNNEILELKRIPVRFGLVAGSQIEEITSDKKWFVKQIDFDLAFKKIHVYLETI